MKIFDKLFFGIKMTWLKVIIGAVIVAVVTAALLTIPGVKDTSISYIGTYIECWLLFALIIIMNCEKVLDAALKTFVFFLISQPLIYLLQVPFSYMGWQLFMYYPRWGVYTVLCFPAAMLAWTIKKNKWWGGIILALPTCFLAYEFVYFLPGLIEKFPHNIVACVFIIVELIVLIFTILKNKVAKIICGCASALALVASLIITFI